MSNPFEAELRRRSVTPPAVAAAPGANPFEAELARRQAPQQPAESGTGRRLLAGVQGAGRGIADVVGFPGDVVAMGANAALSGAEGIAGFVPGLEDTQLPRLSMPSDGLAGLAGMVAEALGYPLADQEEMSGGDRLSYNINRFGSGGIVGGAGGARAATALGSGDDIASMIGRGLQSPYDEAAVNATVQGRGAMRTATETARPLLADAGAGAGVGTAMTSIEDAPADSAMGQLGQIALLLGSGLAGGAVGNNATAPLDGVAKLKALRESNIRPIPGRRPVANFTADEAAAGLQEHSTLPVGRAATNLDDAAARAREFDVPMPTAGTASNDPGLLMQERTSRHGPLGPAFLQRDREISQSAADLVTNTGTGASPRAATEFAGGEVAQQRQGALDRQARATRADESFRAETETRAEGIRARGELKEDAAMRLDRAVVDDTMTPIRRRQSELFDAIDPDGEVRVPLDPMLRRIDQIMGDVPEPLRAAASKLVPEDVMHSVRRLMPEAGDDGVTPPADVSFRDLQNMRPYLSALEQEAGRAGQATKAQALRALRQELGASADRLAAEGGEAGQRAQEALRFSREEVGGRFGQGEGKKLLTDIKRDDAFRTNTPPSATAGRFLKPGESGRENAASLRRILDGTDAQQAGEQAARDFVAADLVKVLRADGTVNPESLRRWIANRRGMFDEMPGLEEEAIQLLRDSVNRRELSGRLAQELEAAKANIRLTEQGIKDSALSLLLDASPEQAAKSLFANGARDRPAAMREIVSKLGKNEEALNGWKQAVTDHLYKSVTNAATETTAEGANPVSLAKLGQMFRDNRETLEALWGPGSREMRDLEQVHEMVRQLARRGLTSKGVGSPTSEDMARIMAVGEAALRIKFGMIKAGGITRTIRKLAENFPAISPNHRVAALIDRAMLDPELASALLRRPVNRHTHRSWNRLLQPIIASTAVGREQAGE